MAALIVAFAGCASAATTLNLYSEGPGNIGKYTIDPLTGGPLEGVLGNYHVLATSAGGTRFWSFCLEAEVYFQSDKTYEYTASGKATDSLQPDPISAGTAYLYELFATGADQFKTLDFYNPAGGAKLQEAIWFLEDEKGGKMNDDVWSLLLTRFGDDEAAMKADYTGTAVGVLNITKYSGTGGDSLAGTYRQDQLVYWGNPPGTTTTTVPDGGATLVFLGLSLGGVGMARRWLKS